MEKRMYDICNALFDHLQEVINQIYIVQGECGRRECSECEYNSLCDRIFKLEIELGSMLYNAYYFESED